MRHRSGRRRRAQGLVLGLAWIAIAATPAWGEGNALFLLERSTGEKPQSKLFHAEGRDWVVLDDPGGLAIFERVGSDWVVNTRLGGIGKADVKSEGSEVLVLVFGSRPELHWLDYDRSLQGWRQRPGFPAAVPKIHASEALVLERDSSGRLWYTAEGDGAIHVYYSVSTQPLTWSSLSLESGVNDDDIATLVAFAGDRIGVFWSDQNRDAFGFRVHLDADPPATWSAKEIVHAGIGHADDHINLAADGKGRVFAVTKDDLNRLHVHRRDVNGQWVTAENVASKGNRGIIMVDGNDQIGHVLYASPERPPARIEYRQMRLDDLSFGKTRTFIAGPLALDDVTGTKQACPRGRLLVMATAADSTVWWNRIDREDPTEVTATPDPPGTRVELSWTIPSRGPAEGYHVYRQVPGRDVRRLTDSPVRETAFTDTAPPDEILSYRVTALFDGAESSRSLEERLDHRPPDPFSRLRFRVGPNPLHRGSEIRFHLSQDTDVRLALHDVRSRRLAILWNQPMPAGDRSVRWEVLDVGGRPLPNGTYYLVLDVGSHREARKVTLLR